jgi:hypothetical protein
VDSDPQDLGVLEGGGEEDEDEDEEEEKITSTSLTGFLEKMKEK